MTTLQPLKLLLSKVHTRCKWLTLKYIRRAISSSSQVFIFHMRFIHEMSPRMLQHSAGVLCRLAVESSFLGSDKIIYCNLSPIIANIFKKIISNELTSCRGALTDLDAAIKTYGRRTVTRIAEEKHSSPWCLWIFGSVGEAKEAWLIYVQPCASYLDTNQWDEPFWTPFHSAMKSC